MPKAVPNLSEEQISHHVTEALKHLLCWAAQQQIVGTSLSTAPDPVVRVFFLPVRRIAVLMKLTLNDHVTFFDREDAWSAFALISLQGAYLCRQPQAPPASFYSNTSGISVQTRHRPHRIARVSDLNRVNSCKHWCASDGHHWPQYLRDQQELKAGSRNIRSKSARSADVIVFATGTGRSLRSSHPARSVPWGMKTGSAANIKLC